MYGEQSVIRYIVTSYISDDVYALIDDVIVRHKGLRHVVQFTLYILHILQYIYYYSIDYFSNEFLLRKIIASVTRVHGLTLAWKCGVLSFSNY